MDTILPPVSWIGGRCYRKNIINPIFQPNASTNESSYRKYQEPETCVLDDNEPIDEQIEITELENGTFKTTLSIPSSFFGPVIGQRGLVKKRIESETGTKIVLHNNTESIVLTSPTEKGIESAKIRIDSIVENTRQKTAFTHFVSIPLNQTSSKSGFLEFRDEVLRDCDRDHGVDLGIFQTPEKLHLTLGTLVLMNQKEREEAGFILEDCKTNIIDSLFDNKPIGVKIEGIEYMNDDPAEVDVLYAKVKCLDDSNKLEILAQKVVDQFLNSGLMLKQYERVKLHMTIMNSNFRKSLTSNDMLKKTRKDTFDARRILDKYSNYHFAKLELSSIHISQRHSFGKDGYYSISSKIDI